SIFEFRHLFTIFPFDKSQFDTDNGSQTNRCLTAHSLNIILGKWVTIGVSEAVVFTRQSGIPDFQYINPVSIYSVVNTNQEGVGNLMLAFQWNIHPFIEDVSFRGQIVLDDFQVDNELITDKEPTHWGADVGLYWKNPFNIPLQHLLKLQYTYKSEWLYTVPDQNADAGERFIYQQKSLGSPSNNGDTCTLGFSIAGKDFWALNGGISYSGKGIYSPLSRWKDSRRGDTILPLDTAYTKQRLASVTIEPLFYFKNFANLRLLFSGNWIKNKDNLFSDKITFSPCFAAELTLHYSNFFLSLPK
ncbi:MAG: hypothetical protein GX640_17610, partial [Fibrobacter sp.]|nr:hypothetical protein [Fibrobacter sp.]